MRREFVNFAADAQYPPAPSRCESLLRSTPWIGKEGMNGEPGGTRTHDHSIKSRMLYQLSYRLSLWRDK